MFFFHPCLSHSSTKFQTVLCLLSKYEGHSFKTKNKLGENIRCGGVTVPEKRAYELFFQGVHTGLSCLLYTQDSAVYHQDQGGRGEPTLCCLRTPSCRRSLIKMGPLQYLIL